MTDGERPRQEPPRAQPTGLATPERIEYLRQCFPKAPWVEVYRKLQHRWPDRHGGVTDAELDYIEGLPGGYSEGMRMRLWREFCLVRWREWIESHYPRHIRTITGVKRMIGHPGRNRARAAQKRAAGGRVAVQGSREAESAVSGPRRGAQNISRLFE